MRNKTSEIEVLLKTKLRILCFTEHWLDENECPLINEYSLASVYYRTHADHGGTCVYVQHGLCFQDLQQTDLITEIDFEYSAVQINSLKLIVICVYRSPDGDLDIFCEKLDTVLQHLKDKILKYKLVICGDFNVHYIPRNAQDKKQTHKLNLLLKSFGLIPIVKQPTRGEYLIDNIYVDKQENYSAEIINDALSDHVGILLNSNETQPNQVPTIFRRIYSRNKLQALHIELSQQNWSQVYSEKDVNTAYSGFHSILSNLIKPLFPYKRIKKGSNKADNWITKGIRISCKTKRRKFILYQAGEVTKEEYTRYANLLKKVIICAKRLNYERQIRMSNNKAKTTWNIINTYKGRVKSVQSFTDNISNGENRQFTLNKANLEFLNMCPNMPEAQSRTNQIRGNAHSMFLLPATEGEVQNVIRSIKNTKSEGWDEVPVVILKENAEVLSTVLCHLINRTMQEGMFPDLLKIANVQPVFKKGDPSDVNNYRQIAILSNISKIFEKILHNRLSTYFEEKQLITMAQNGFRKNKSTIRTIYQTLTNIFDSFNNNEITVGVFLDLSKAFDSIRHDILLDKLERYGVRGITLQLIQSYLTDRKQCLTELDTNTGLMMKSQYATITKGVPQGSILGPLLYIIYTNDLPHCIEQDRVHLEMYADDTSLVFRDINELRIRQTIQDILRKTEEWFSINNLTLNIGKTEIIDFSSRQHPTSYYKLTETQLIMTKNSTKFLGLEVDSELNWKDHVNRITLKLSKTSYLLRNLSFLVSQTAALTAYHALVESAIRYGVVLWGASVDADEVFLMQKRCIRSIFHMKQTESCREVFIQHKLPTFYAICVLECIIFIKENTDLFQDFQRSHAYELRNKKDLNLPAYKLTRLQRNATFLIVKIYNKVPSEVRGLPTTILKRKLKDFLATRPIYSFEEFMDLDLATLAE